MGSNYGVIGFVKPPTLAAVSKAAPVKFKEEFDVYKEKCSDVNRSRSSDTKIVIATIRDCIDGQLLAALVKMKKIPDANTVDQATFKRVDKWFQGALNFAPQDLSERIDAVLSVVKYTKLRGDPAGSALTFCVDVMKALSTNVAEDVLEDVDQAVKFIDRLVEKLGISCKVLRERMKMRREGWTKKERGDFSKFESALSSLAIDVHQNEVAFKRSNKSANSETKAIKKSNASTSKAKEERDEEVKGGTKVRKRKRDNSEWTEKCLNPKCDKVHMLRDCPDTSTELKKELLKKRWEEKKKKAEETKKQRTAKSMKQSTTAETSNHSTDDGRFNIIINNVVQDVALGDYGSDFNAMPQSTFTKILKATPKVISKQFSPPMELMGAFKTDKETFSTSKSAVLNITLILPGSNIRVRIRGVKFYVVDQDMDECLLSRSLLQSMGFNLKDHLERVHHMIDGKHVDDLNPSTIKAAALKYGGLSYDDADDDPIQLPEGLSAGIGRDSRESIDNAFQSMIANAVESGISTTGSQRLKHLLDRYRDVFRIKLGPDPPAKVAPLVISRTENAKPFRSPQRRYAPLQREFIIRTIRELEAVGAIYKNNSSRWASPALAVPKPGSSKLRFTVDLRGPNSSTVPIQSAMPHLESLLQDIEGSICFANVDLAHGYWQIPLAEESQEMMSIQTPIGVYSSRRLVQGGSDSGNHFQAVLGEKFQGRVNNLIQWLDDFLFFARDEEGLLNDIQAFLKVCQEINLKVHAEKSSLFSKRVQFCGRIITSEGIQYHPRHFDSLVSMKKPTMAGELQQLLCATNWMRSSIPNYSEVIEPLHNLMEEVYSRAGGKRTKRAVRNLSITAEWGATHDVAFRAIIKQLAAAVKLSHPKSEFELCLFTDASDTHWSGILTQAPSNQRDKAIDNQDHEPLCFLSGAFKGSSKNWSVPEKEGFAIVESMCRVDYLVMGREVSIYTDHANLVQLYDPYGKHPGIPRHTASKLMRWAIKLSAFRYVVEHLPGERNVWADMLTRWAVCPNSSINVKKVGRLKSLMMSPINPGLDPELDWPNLNEVISSQKNAQESPPASFQHTDEGWVNEEGAIWIPSSDESLKLRILIAAHTGHGGHRSGRVTHASIKPHFRWTNLGKDVETFVKSCLHCIASAPGTVVPRPLGHVLHATKPNKLLHFDFCHMGTGEKGNTYVLILKDDFSGYVWLIPSKEATAEVVADSLISWFSSFGVVTEWVSDRGTHFKNELVTLLQKQAKAGHHFTLAYCPWSNGTVEVVCRELIRTSRALLSEFQLPHSAWPQVLPIVQSILNNSMLPRLGNRCPLTAFTSLPQYTPLTSIKTVMGNRVSIRSVEDIQSIQREYIETLQAALDKMHKEVVIASNKKRKSAIESHNRKTNVRPVNFFDGDYVLRGLVQGKARRKPSIKWHGPYRVVECRSNYIFVIEDLLTGEREEAHGRRLRFFRNSSFQVTEELRHHLAYQKNELLVIEEFTGIRRKGTDFELRVKWRGFPDTETDWTPLATLQEDVPEMVRDYVQDLLRSGTPRERTLAASI